MLLTGLGVTPQKKHRFYSENQLRSINPQKIPRHIAIIPDGNRRWAKNNLLSFHKGHRRGSEILIDIVKAASELGVQTLTLYAFSTENWNRTQIEISLLMKLIIDFLNEYQEVMQENGVKLEVIGDPTPLPQELQSAIYNTKQATKESSKIRLVLAINYGARDELTRAFKKMIGDCKKGLLHEDSISKDTVGRYLDTAEWGDPDLLIRTSGEARISNYLLWQLSYAELYFTEKLWPDFKPDDLLEAIIDFQSRERRWGKDG